MQQGDRTSENAVWGYPNPYDEVAAIRDFVAFYWDRVDHWYEEDEEIFVHPRDPYKRVDVIASSRPAQLSGRRNGLYGALVQRAVRRAP